MIKAAIVFLVVFTGAYFFVSQQNKSVMVCKKTDVIGTLLNDEEKPILITKKGIMGDCLVEVGEGDNNPAKVDCDLAVKQFIGKGYNCTKQDMSL